MSELPGPAGVRVFQDLGGLQDQPAVLRIIRDMRGELATAMGIEIVEFTTERITATMPVAGNRQPYGLLHGGANAVLAETLGSFHAVLVSGGKTAVGIELNCTHHRAATDGQVTGVSRPIHIGRTMTTFEIVVKDEANRRLCTARLSCLIREPR